MRALATLCALLAAAAFAQAPPAQCRADSECTLSDFAGCCGSCCGGDTHAVSLAELQRERARCAAVDCARPNCSAVKCLQRPPVLDARAVCRQGSCVMETGVNRSECRADADCVLTYPATPPDAACRRSPCGCCPPSQPVAVPRDSRPHILDDEKVRPELPDRRRLPATPPEETQRPAPDPRGPQYGLHEGGPTPPNCSPCPAPKPARAVCRVGRCAVEPLRVPLPR